MEHEGAQRASGHEPLWYKDAVIYQLHVKAFKDSNDDGIGDFRGLTEKLDYIADLGVNTIWLLPFYPSPMRDDGYDVADYRRIHPPYGSRADFRRFIRGAHRRGLRVITELVINHTSDQHPWFQASRHAPRGSAKRNYYVWSDDDGRYEGTRIIFKDTETSNWAWDPVAQQYYWHRFFSHQPDLNFGNPAVIKAVIRVMRFWFDLGVDGMRLDAIPYLCEREGTNNENLPETHEVLKEMRAVVDAHYSDRMFLAEANQWPEDVLAYFGDGDECHVAYHFPLMPRLYMALAQEDRHPIVEILEQTPAIPDTCQWAIFLRNHDELTLEMVTDEERDYMYATYAREPRARINVGIRRRLAPLLDNDKERIKLLKSVLLSMPGSPILYYGDEIGMGDNVFLGDRNGVRTPMQWTPDRNAGFSRADPQELYLPPIMDPIYGYPAVNVEAQSRDSSTMLNWTRRLIAVRQSTRTFGRGSLTMLSPGNRHVLAYLREHEGEVILCVANLARTAQPVELDLSDYQGLVPVDILGRSPFPPVEDLPYLLTLSSHGFFWFRLTAEAEVPAWHVERLPRSNLVTLVLTEGWTGFFPEQLPRARQSVAATALSRFVDRALPEFLRGRRWFAGKNLGIEAVTLDRRVLWEVGARQYLLAWLRVRASGGAEQVYFLPLALAWGGDQEEPVRGLLPTAVARVREHARVGVLVEAFRESEFCRSMVAAMGKGEDEALSDGSTLRFTATTASGEILRDLPEDAGVHVAPGETTNTIVNLGDVVFLKILRRVEPGPSPELEIGRFLTDHTGFRHFPRLIAAMSYDDGETSTVLALAQELKPSQGDGWHYMTGYLERFLEDAQFWRPGEPHGVADSHAENASLLATLGRRTGELHVALATPSDDPDFSSVPVAADDVADWVRMVREDVDHTLERLETALAGLPESARAAPEWLLANREALLGAAGRAELGGFRGLKTRYHGDFHLGQVLVAENDFIITDFEGEPARSLAERRRKHSPLRDVAGMLRSLQYAAEWAIRTVSEVGLGDPALVRGHALRWLDQASAAFLAGYAEATRDSPVYGPDLDGALAVVDLFVLEKALYEVRYELASRPEWLHLPILGLRHHLERERRGTRGS